MKYEKLDETEEPSSTRTGEYDVNDVVEAIQWGLYQYKVMFVMGLSNFADCAEIWLAAIILHDLACEWKLDAFQQAIIPAVLYFWYAFGSIFSGKMADYYGRYPILLVNCYLLVISAILSAFCTNYYFYILCRAITGFCIGGNYGTAIVYSAEMQPITKRSPSMLFLFAFWTLGSLYVLVVAYFVMGLQTVMVAGFALTSWRIQVLLTAIPCVLMLVCMHFIDESPRYLTITNQPEKAMRVVTKMCHDNNVSCPEGQLVCREVRRVEFRDMFTVPYTKTSALIAVLFFTNIYLLFGVIILIPDMMTLNWCNMSQFFETKYVNSEGCEVRTKAAYLFEMVLAALWFPGFCLGSGLVAVVGRITGLRIATFSCAVSTILLLLCVNAYISYVVLVCAVMSYAALVQVLWIYVPELYPSYMRATAVGVHNGIGKFGAAAGTFLSAYLDHRGIQYTLYTFIFMAVVSAVTSLFFSQKEDETQGEALLDGRDEVRHYGASKEAGSRGKTDKE